MKYVVTSITLSPSSRRRMGKATTKIVDTLEDTRYRVNSNIVEVERRFETLYSNKRQIVKVVDIRQVTNV